MKTLNFKQFRLYTDIEHTQQMEIDLRKDLSNALYTNARGIAAHDLAFRIYRSDGAIEVSDEEVAILKDFINGGASAAVIDALNEQLEKQPT